MFKNVAIEAGVVDAVLISRLQVIRIVPLTQFKGRGIA